MIQTRSSTALSTHSGGRARNEDAVLSEILPDGAELIAVADGMGGHAGGEIASRLALRALADTLADGATLHAAVAAANAAVLARATAEPELEGMGTTLVALLRRGDSYEVVNVGDSRAYRVTTGGIERLTDDHSFEAEAARNGMAADEIARSPWRSALMRAIGTDAELEPDVFGPWHVNGEPHAVLLCTDGLYRMLEDADIARRYRAAANVEFATLELVERAAALGSPDNVSAAAIEFGTLRAEPAAAGSAVPGAGTTPEAPPLFTTATATAAAAPHVDVPGDVALRETASPTPKLRQKRKRARRPRPPIRWETVLFAVCSGGLALLAARVLLSL